MRRVAWLSAPLVVSLAWTLALLFDSASLSPVRSILVVSGLLAMSSVSVVGMVVTGGRWAHRLGLATLALCLPIALIRGIDVWWIAATALTAVASSTMLSPATTDQIRKLPGATGPPPEAVLVPLVLLAVPVILGLLGYDSDPVPLAVVGLTAPLTAFWFSRVFPGGLVASRVGWPILALALAPTLGWAGGAASGSLAVIVAWLAWRPGVKPSFHPPSESGTTFPIPPEMTPTEILDAARIDDTGRPL